MKVPKHYRLHEATNDFVFLDEGAVVATNGTILARVPLTSDGIRLDGTEGPPRAIPAKAWADAVRGSKGEGSLDLSEPDNPILNSAARRLKKPGTTAHGRELQSRQLADYESHPAPRKAEIDALLQRLRAAEDG